MTESNKCCPDLQLCLPPELFKALSDPNRIAILAQVAGQRGELSVNEVAGCCVTDLSVVSRHLRTLREAGILSARKLGKQVFYRANFGDLIALLRNLADALEQCCPGEPLIMELTSGSVGRPENADEINKNKE